MEIELEITDLSRGGAGIGKDPEGRVIFVPLTAPGDRVRARIHSKKKNYAHAELLEVLHDSPTRVTPRCPAFGRCGGCQWQHLPYELQWKTKAGGVTHALKRVGIAPPPLEEIPATQIWEYRNRIQLRGEIADGETQLGFYASQSHALIPLERCDIARAELNSVWESTRREASRRPMPLKVELEVGEDGEIHTAWNQRHSAHGFKQVHDEQNEKLRAWVRNSLTPGAPILDLFGGNGNLSLPLAETSPEIHCVDLWVPQTSPATNYRFHRAPVLPWLKKFKTERKGWSVIIDPPRDGVGRDLKTVIDRLEDRDAKEALVIGCEPDAWARDLSTWIKRGWRLDKIAALDFFPHTPHVEALARLTARA